MRPFKKTVGKRTSNGPGNGKRERIRNRNLVVKGKLDGKWETTHQKKHHFFNGKREIKIIQALHNTRSIIFNGKREKHNKYRQAWERCSTI